MRVYCPTGSNTALSRASVMYPMMRSPHRQQQQQPLPRSATLRRRRRVLELAAIRRRLLCLPLGDRSSGGPSPAGSMPNKVGWTDLDTFYASESEEEDEEGEEEESEKSEEEEED